MDLVSFEREARLIGRLSNHLLQHVVPLFANGSNGKPQLIGSSVLVSSEDCFYLISAAHVFDEIKAGHELFFYITPKTIRKLSGSLRLTKLPPCDNRKYDHLDIGVLKLEGLALPPYPQVNKFPVPLSALMANALPREEKQYLLVGFPASKSRPNPVARDLVSEPYSFRNISAPLSKYAELKVESTDHIVLSFDVSQTVMPNSEVRKFPDPKGMSGSPVWLLHDQNGSNNVYQTPIVGIAVEHRKQQRAIIATDINIALQLINEAD
jgi:hypothetical protein